MSHINLQSRAHTVDVAELTAWLAAHRRVVAITGAGVSTASGIPDYRDAQGNWKRPAPIQHTDFVRSAATRQRYWARSLAGWPHFSRAVPNTAHRGLAALEQSGHLHGLVTQNVDGLHQRAGSSNVVDLHGRLDQVQCLECGASLARDAYQLRLLATNPEWDSQLSGIAPDGDADLAGADYHRFEVPACTACGGVLKPAVIFYGGKLMPATRAAAEAAVAQADAVLVVGSSLIVWSAYSLVQAAVVAGTQVAAINQGRTRADALLAFKCEADCGTTLAAMAAQLSAQPAAKTPSQPAAATAAQNPP